MSFAPHHRRERSFPARVVRVRVCIKYSGTRECACYVTHLAHTRVRYGAGSETPFSAKPFSRIRQASHWPQAAPLAGSGS